MSALNLGETKQAVFLRRPNRFLAELELDGERISAYLPDPGRLEELLFPGNKALVREAVKKKRLTHWDMVAVDSEAGWVNVDSHINNEIFAECLEQGKLKEFRGYSSWRANFRYGESVLDFFLEGRRNCLVEVKGCTLVRNKVALFPDAPTSRGVRHLKELERAAIRGWRACLVVVVKREDAQAFTSNDLTDPAFGETLRRVHSRGVEIYAYLAPMRGNEIAILGPVPVDLELGLRLAEGGD